MPSFNRVIIAGNLTADPDLKYTPSGKAICNFTVAINSFWTDKQGKKNEEVSFIPVVVWARQAETSAEFLSKGKPVLCEGRLRQEKWVNKEKQNRSRLVMVANLVRFLGAPTKGKQENVPEEPEQNGVEEDPGF